jgi:hypothetical protein
VILLTEPTCWLLGLPPGGPISGSDVAAGVRRLLAATDAVELAQAEALEESLDELVLGVVEAVEECACASPPCENLRARAELEAARWVDDFIADDVAAMKPVSESAMFIVAQVLADAVADALRERTRASRIRADSLGVRGVLEDLRRRAIETVRWSRELPTPCAWLRR